MRCIDQNGQTLYLDDDTSSSGSGSTKAQTSSVPSGAEAVDHYSHGALVTILVAPLVLVLVA